MNDTTPTPIPIPRKMIDITNKEFGSLIAKFPYRAEWECSKVLWHCVCECGNTVGLSVSVLSAGKRTSCGRGQCNTHVIDISGQQFDRLTAVSYEADGLWKCSCSCDSGKITYARSCDLRSGIRKSCGCFTNAVSDEVAAFNTIYHTYKNSASKRGLVFELRREVFDAMIRAECHYCGDPPRSRPIVIAYKLVHPDPVYIAYTGIDRKDPLIGYTIDNCVSCCTLDNRAKGDMQYDEYLVWSHNKTNFILQGRGI
jgi:hypothetical protein